MFHYTDQSVGLDQVLIQLQAVVPHWRDLAEAVGMDTKNMESIKKHVKHHTSPIRSHLTLPMKLENLHKCTNILHAQLHQDGIHNDGVIMLYVVIPLGYIY